jgi:hypothetical protein
LIPTSQKVAEPRVSSGAEIKIFATNIDTSGARGVHPQSAVLEQRLMRGLHGPHEQKLLGERIGLRVRHVMRGDERAEIGEPRGGREGLGALDVGAPDAAGAAAPSMMKSTFMETSLVVQV